MYFQLEKNITSKKLALWSAIVIAIICFLLMLILNQSKNTIAISTLVLFLSTYVIFYFTIDFFFNRKIKLIYKFISSTKAGNANDTVPTKSIDEVSKDVMNWANEQQNNIAVLEKNEQFRKEFLMNFAHEIKTPIFTVQGYLTTLQDGAMENESVRLKFISNALKGIDRLSALVSNIDQIAKLENGTLVLHKEQFVFQDLVTDVYQEFDLIAQENNLQLTIKAGCESPVTVFADKQKIKQVLVNLINNAIRYSLSNGTIKTGIYIVDEKSVYAEVTDIGSGIDDEHIARVFERFYRTDNGRSRNAGGSGLGLAIVKHIIEAHGHSVTCRSKIGIGSSFGFGLDR